MKIDPQAAARARAFLDANLERKRREVAQRLRAALAEGLRTPDLSPEVVEDRLMQVFELLAVCESLRDAGPAAE